MRVMMLIDSLVKGGRERRMLELLKGLSQYPQIQCEIVVFSKKIVYEEVYDLGLPIHILERQPEKDPRVFYRLYRLCRRFRPDILHTWGSMSSVYAVPTAKMLGIKLLNAQITNATDDLGWSDVNWFRARLTFPFSDAVLANSYAGLKAYNAPETKSYCLHNGFDFKRISHLKPASEIRKQFGITTPYVVGMVGAFEDRKDYPLYIDTALNIVQEREDVSFLAIGDGKHFEACRARVPEAQGDQIIFTGVQNEVESIIDLFDIGVLVTNQTVHGEGISNAIMEYMALGKPVIASRGGGTSEIVIEGQTGLLIDEPTVDIWTQALTTLLDDPDRAEKMGAAGKERVLHDFNLEKMIDAYVALYEHLLKASVGKLKIHA